MNKTLKWIAILGMLLPATFAQSAVAEYQTADLQRLHWLCSDYQLPIQGYVVECWFQVIQVPGMESFLEQNLKVEAGMHQKDLDAGGVLFTSMQLKKGKWQIELQLITKNWAQAQQYYACWQQFSDKYYRSNPVGVTIISELAEPLNMLTSEQLANELAEGLDLQMISNIQTEQYIQVSGRTRQLLHGITVNGETVNASVTIMPQKNSTQIYIASPILYQQF